MNDAGVILALTAVLLVNSRGESAVGGEPGRRRSGIESTTFSGYAT